MRVGKHYCKHTFMERPFTICHMMMSVDGRIDCDMTEKIGDSESYYTSLASLKCPSTLIGRVTMMTHYTDGSTFQSQSKDAVGQAINVAKQADGYFIVADSRGTLNVTAAEYDGLPLLVAMSEDAPADYAAHLAQIGANYIAVGKGSVDLASVVDTLATKFGVERLAVVGGGAINGAMLKAGLIDEVSVIVGAGVDGRTGQPSLFEGMSSEGWGVTRLRLQGVARVGAEAVWLRYDVAQK